MLGGAETSKTMGVTGVNDATPAMPAALEIPETPNTSDLASWRATGLTILVALTLLIALLPQQPGTTALLAAADQQRALWRYDRALALDAQARTVDPDDPRPACAQGQILLLQRETGAAIRAYQTCAALAPDSGDDWLALGNALAQQADTASQNAAVGAWTRAAHLGATAAWARLAERDELVGQLDAAAVAWGHIPSTSADTTDAQLAAAHLGLLALARGDSPYARFYFSRLTNANTSLMTQLRDTGALLFAQVSPTVEVSWLGIGHALLSMNMPTAALAPLRRAVSLAPNDAAAHAYYGFALWVLGQRAAARPQIAAGIAGPAPLPFAWYAAGEEALADGHAALALTYLQTGALHDPRNPTLWNATGDAAVYASQYLVAELSYKNAAQYSDTPDATVKLVQFYLDHGVGVSDGTALQAAHDGLWRFPNDERLVFLEALIYQNQAVSDQAQALFAEANQLDPSDPGPWYYVGSAAVASGQTAPAIVDLRTAIALQPNGAYAAQARALLLTLTPGTSM